MSLKIAINGRFLTQRASGVQRFAAKVNKATDALLVHCLDLGAKRAA